MFSNQLVALTRKLFPRMRVYKNILKNGTWEYNLTYPVLRHKYTQHKGVKGIRSRKSFYEAKQVSNAGDDDDNEQDKDLEPTLNLEDRDYDEVASNAMNVSRSFNISQNVFVIQPYVKWGAKKNTNITPDNQIKEAEALVRSLPNWSIGLSVKVPLESLEKKTLFGSGKMEELKLLINQQYQIKPLTCIFVSKGTLTFAQKRLLEAELNLPIMDRYSVVIQILRLHATTAEARLQVAMAEIPYIWAQAKEASLSVSRKQGYSLTDTQREILKTRERKLKLELERIRSHRKLLRSKRKRDNYPIVAVVGYTNSGKTSLIKALTDEQEMQPRDQLFATLDVTAHAGMLPCNLEVIYMDTVGFMSDLPTGLIECFVATLEDAMLADVIVHVQDLSHDCYQAQISHVENTLKSLIHSISASIPSTATTASLPTIVNVGNKIDLITAEGKPINSTLDDVVHMVSAKSKLGLNKLLLDIEDKILVATERQKLTMRVRSGGSEMAWLYKNAAVINMRPCKQSAEHMLMYVVISVRQKEQFKQQFCQ